MSRLKEEADLAPDLPGIYLMKDESGKIIYIGKAKSLKKRLVSYFGRELNNKTMALMSNVRDIEFQLTATEGLAILLEAGLIHRHKPKYNVSLRDDKSFPLVKIAHEEFPAIYITRKRMKDRARYLGPFTSAKLLRQTLKVIRRILRFRSCKRLPKKPCIYFRLNLCQAPCVGAVKKSEYDQVLKRIILILEGRVDDLIEELSRWMHERSALKDYEEAANLRDQINALSALTCARSQFSSQDELEGLRRLLRLKKLPYRIEAFDISNICGKESVGSMVSFWCAKEDKNNYRRFRIKTVEGIDDYRMLAEVIRRRYQRIKNENLPLPDLILIDGGKNHLLVAHRELKKLGLELPLVSIAKEFENIYTIGQLKPIRLREDTPALNLIRRIRNEAHRFAIAYHHILRRRKIIGK